MSASSRSVAIGLAAVLFRLEELFRVSKYPVSSLELGSDGRNCCPSVFPVPRFGLIASGGRTSHLKLENALNSYKCFALIIFFSP